MRRPAEYVEDQDWWWRTSHTPGIMKAMQQRFSHHKKPHWQMLLSFVVYAKIYKPFKLPRQARHLRGHPLSQRQLLQCQQPRRQPLHLKMRGYLRLHPPTIPCRIAWRLR